jgi:membrane protein implicated in regulation of membrane protease activity
MLVIPWWAWTILGAVLALAELHAPGSYLIWVAVGAALTAAADAAWGLSITGQLGVFAAASALSCVAGYFVYRKAGNPLLDERAPLNQRNAAMVGARGTVSAPLVGGLGKVRLGDSVWLAEGPDLAEGTPVVVTSVRGTRLSVEAAAPGR